MDQQQGVCALCGRRDRPLTREHVFARWLVTKVKGARLTASHPAPEPARISRVHATVCADCNAGWMSTLEVSFRQAFFARPRVGPIHPADRTTLSRWFAKTAVLVADALGPPLIDHAERAALLRGLPADIEVFVARRRRPRQRLDYAVVLVGSTTRTVGLQVEDIVAHVARRGTLTSREGTQLWPLRTHALRWETLPVRSASQREEIRGV